MNLPETCCISIQGPANLLDLDGFHWGDDIIFDSTNGGLDSDAGFKKTNEILKGVVEDGLVGKCGYRPREVLLMGFGQGGMAALEYAGMTSSHISNVMALTDFKSHNPRPQNWAASSPSALACRPPLQPL